MKCYVLDSLDEQFQSDQQRKEVSAEAAEKINKIVQEYKVYRTYHEYDEAQTDGGIDGTVEYEHDSENLLPENIVVYKDEIVGYVHNHKMYLHVFNPNKDVVIYESHEHEPSYVSTIRYTNIWYYINKIENEK